MQENAACPKFTHRRGNGQVQSRTATASCRWRNWGHWNVGPNTQGKFYELNDETESITVYYDTEGFRIYYMILGH